MEDALKCINCGVKFELLLRRSEYSCPYCNTSYKVKHDITIDDVKPKQSDRALTVDIRFNYKGNLWNALLGLMVTLILGVVFSVLAILNEVPIFAGILGGFIGFFGAALMIQGIIGDRKKYRAALIKRINQFHEQYFKAEKNAMDNIKWSLVRVGATELVSPITIKTQEGNQVRTVKCSSCGSSVDLKNFFERNVFTCKHCSAIYEKKVTEIGKTGKVQKPKVEAKPKPKRDWKGFVFLTFMLGLFIALGIVDLITNFANGTMGKYIMPPLVAAYIGFCFMFYYGKL